MAELSASNLEAIKTLPIKDELTLFCTKSKSKYFNSHASFEEAIDQVLRDKSSSNGKDLVLDLILALQNSLVTRPFIGDLFRLGSQVTSNTVNLEIFAALLKSVFIDTEDTEIWAAFIYLITQTRPAPQPRTPPPSLPSFVSSVQQTPWSFNTSQFANTSEFREH
ncbi:MAG: hypothetical protein M1834_001004, partial [Cirrosporium novae-zelandiae]